ncbi:MAG TPA: DUF3828 domain-containing protein [Pyrinomonadaceae bacterium]|nr:DUF3828 domain-containing protein [Pyrinomonadaceae bacterium]
MLKLFQRTIAGPLVLMAGVALLSPLLAMPARAQRATAPEDVVRGFYSWYLHQLSAENSNPLKQKTTALKYLTPQLYANAPRLIRRMDADIFICAQDWDKDWERNFSVSTPEIKNSTATATVILPSGETDKIKINVALIKTASGWRINKVACAN